MSFGGRVANTIKRDLTLQTEFPFARKVFGFCLRAFPQGKAFLYGGNMKIGVIGIIIERNKDVVQAVQALLSDNADIILGRMGIPDKVSGVSVISLIVKATNERISALTGKLGRLKSVKVKSAVTEIESVG